MGDAISADPRLLEPVIDLLANALDHHVLFRFPVPCDVIVPTCKCSCRRGIGRHQASGDQYMWGSSAIATLGTSDGMAGFCRRL